MMLTKEVLPAREAPPSIEEIERIGADQRAVRARKFELIIFMVTMAAIGSEIMHRVFS